MADPMSTAYFGGPRHAPKAEVASPDLDDRKPVASFSNPAGNTQSWTSTGAITNAAGQRNRKRPGGSAGLGGLSTVDGPVDADAGQAIVDDFQSKLGQVGQAAEERPESTGDMTSPDHPMMGGLSRGRVSAYGRDFQQKIFQRSPAEQQMSEGVDTSAPASKPRIQGQYDDAGNLNFFAGDDS